ncbi:DNA primase [Lysobacter sp. TY2-98]|uniref:DNA primase n=1 Tax=Lysobacter sp. TY2-98 TaxID=2290922 RepID=UPI000E20AF91|nr:DNA primase [Lysobacter sp. TY2-98]AXK72987.1 DNA primase [Lysobacter sp. TY2-98]
MARIPDAFIDDLLARTDIVEVVGSRVPLKRQGKEFSARCPFHDERSPSFTVSPVKQFYHCFGCGAHGTAISFVMQYDRLEFLDAVEELAKRVGMDVPKETTQRAADPQLQALYGVVESAMVFFRQQLKSNAKAREYFDRRGVSEAIREQFQLGYAPDGFEALKNALGTDATRLGLLERAGLFSKNDSGRVYDKFRDRVMFPIHDRRGRPIAFGGRVIEKDASPKYLNSPETQLFHKGRELYGLWQVRGANSKIERLIVVEGYMDVIALFQHGVTQAVATLGTATTSDHAELLFRNAPDVYFCFDGDRAGRGAAWKAVESVLPRMKDGRQAFYLFLPEGEDPDTIVRNEGREGFEARLQSATPLSQFLFDTLAQDVNLATLEGKGRLAERAKPMLAQIPDGAFADLMRQRLTELTGVGARAASPETHVPTQRAHGPSRHAPPPKQSLVRSAILRLLHKPALALEVSADPPFASLRQPGVPLLVELIGLVHARPDIGAAALIEHFAGREEQDPLQKLVVQQLPGIDTKWQEEFLDNVNNLTRDALDQRTADLQARMSEVGFAGMSDAEKDELKSLLARRAVPRSSDST